MLNSPSSAADAPVTTLRFGQEPGVERRNTLWDTVVFLPGSWDESFRRYLLRAFAQQRRGLGKVVCVERPKGPRWPNYRQVEDNLWVLTPGVLAHPLIAERIPGLTPLNQYLLRRQLQKTGGEDPLAGRRTVVWLFHPFQAEDIQIWPNDLVLYDCYDRYDEPPEPMSAAWKKKVLAREKTLMDRADLILTVSEPLQELKTAQGFTSHRVPNAVDGDFFAKALDSATVVPKDLARIPSPRLGFMGQMSDRIDFVLLDRLAEQRPHYSLVLVGEVRGQLQADKQAALRRLQRRANVYFLGARPYEQLPNYLKGFDLCLVPYADSLFNRFSSPLKIYEYLASGKPVVSVSTPEIETFWEVVNVTDRNAFAQAVDRELQRTDDLAYREKRLARARENSWEQRATTIIGLIHAQRVPLPTAQKVLHLVTGFEVGDGIVEMVAALSSQLHRQRFVPLICALRGSGSYREVFEQQGIPVKITDLGSPHDRRQYLRAFQVIREVRGLLKKERVHLLHAHNFFAGVIGLLASWGLPGVRRVLTMHGYYYFESWTHSPLKAFLRRTGFHIFFRAWDNIVGVSDAVSRWVASFGTPSARIKSILNGIRSERFKDAGDRSLYRRRWQIPADAKLIGTLGIVEKVKGGDCLLEAAKQVLAQHPNSYFVFIGAQADHEPETLAGLQRQQERLGLQGRVIFTERVLDVHNAIAALDVFVFSSTHAGFGLAVAEAMYLRKPVIACAIGGIPEIMEDKLSGLLVPAEDPHALSQAIHQILSDAPLAEKLGETGRQRVEKRFLAQRMAMDYERLYAQLTHQRSKGEV